MADQTWTCSKCTPPRTFESSDQCRVHSLNYHASTFAVTVLTKSGLSKQITVTQIDGVYPCPFCSVVFKTKGGCRKHLDNLTCTSEEKDNDEPGQQPPVIAMPSYQTLPVPIMADSTPQMREYNDAVLYSCNQTHVSDAEKQRTLGIVDALELRPFAIKDPHGAEQNGLAHISVIAKLSAGEGKVASNMPPPKKRKHAHHDACPICTPTPAPGLEYVLSTSPYAASIQRRKYTELDNGVCELFNRDWEFSPHLRFACAKILAGCLLLNNQNGQVIIANTIEVYGRTRLVDAHREPFVVRKGQPVANSLPPSIKTPYKNVWPTTVSAQDGERLIIGTLSFDALITSSLRLDTRMNTSVGCATPSFLLSSTSHSLATKIFLDQESLDDGLQLAKGKDTWSVSSSNLMWQLRQTKTKFHDPSTYYLCRASSPFANKHPCHPYTIFTLVAFDQAHNGDGSVLSRLFHTLASRVIRDAREAVIDKQTVEELRNQCVDQTNASKGLDGILTLFSGTQTSIKILGNLPLNNTLQVLAPLMSTYITKANASVMAFVEKEFMPIP
ncbi:hypothetical protein BGZ96_000713 [Linnemannia gamsii]|uniref:C2H2-type domain-containing protein n=1 Tax=Linnemannia gamsii TaxID=64522 RepID=A0ABQ7JNQ4_9FUNG|nr:hypothetical protein BGZ96_000713 [Linnemannia gamsii]